MVETHKTTIALGCMNFGKRTPAAEAERIIARAIERGITVFDTANMYNDGESERILGKDKSYRSRALRLGEPAVPAPSPLAP